MVDSKNTLYLYFDTSLFSALAQGTLDEILIKVDSAAWYPPASISSLVDSHIFAIAVLFLVRVPHDNQAELVSLKDSSSRCHLEILL